MLHIKLLHYGEKKAKNPAFFYRMYGNCFATPEE